VLFALHFIQDATALHSAPFAIFENCPVASIGIVIRYILVISLLRSNAELINLVKNNGLRFPVYEKQGLVGDYSL
jgi:hypothetical protein